ALEIDGEIISADSRQIYKGFVIGTSTPLDSPVPYHLVNFLEPERRFSAMEFKRCAEMLINDIGSRGKNVIVSGGTGLYIRALEGKLFSGELRDEKIREKILARFKAGENLWEELNRVDPELSSRIHRNDFVRIARALEVYYITGKPMSFFHKQGKYEKQSFEIRKFILTMDRNELYKRIDERVDEMIRMGWIDEVKSLLERGINEDAPAFESVGYKEIIAYLKGEISLENAVRRIKKRTRQYARRQIIWFKKETDATIIDLSKTSLENAKNYILKEIASSY
ncbi:MAG: tRNA (adenosine(37)-N6)-dimethylallyltransferase MiaA, partial [bacterium]